MSKAVKTAKPVKKTAGKTERTLESAAKKAAVKNKEEALATSPAQTAAKPAVGKAVADSVNPAPKTKAPKSPATKSKVEPAAPQPAAKPKTARAGGQAAAPPPAPLATPRPAPLPSRSAVMPRAVVIKKDPRLIDNWKIKPVEQWIDAEVICMPDEEYMSDKQLAFFRLKLLHLKNDILANAGETTEHLRSDTVVVPDPADRATIEEEHALELRTRDRERKLLRKIDQSITRIDSGDYGYCDETGEPIGVARLLARPTATLTLEAQQRRELKQKLFGD
jgi:DnaK suppressor protein